MEPKNVTIIRNFDIGAGDILVFRHPGRLSPAGYEHAVRSLKEAFPEFRLILLEEGMTVDSVVRIEAAQ